MAIMSLRAKPSGSSRVTLPLVIYMFTKSFDGRNLRGFPDYEVNPQKFENEELLLNVL
jgi:hypothetical protein